MPGTFTYDHLLRPQHQGAFHLTIVDDGRWLQGYVHRLDGTEMATLSGELDGFEVELHDANAYLSGLGGPIYRAVIQHAHTRYGCTHYRGGGHTQDARYVHRSLAPAAPEPRVHETMSDGSNFYEGYRVAIAQAEGLYGPDGPRAGRDERGAPVEPAPPLPGRRRPAPRRAGRGEGFAR